MKEKITVYNRKILEELVQKYPEKWEKIKYVNKKKWLTGKDYPSYTQLVNVAKEFNIPFGYLFLDKLPEKKVTIPHYRTLESNTPVSEIVSELITQVQKQQEWAKEILINWGHKPLPYAGKYTIQSPKFEIINEIKKLLQVENHWANEQINWSKALHFLIDKYEQAGIFVVKTGIVGNNTRKKIDVNECRGFVLYDEIAPFVFINSNDSISAQIFTLIHELVHILIGQSASFDLSYLESTNNEVEKFCDSCTAEFLVPEEELEKTLNTNEINYEQLAQKYKVSQIVIARRLLDLSKIDKEKFYRFYAEYMKKENRQKQGKGGDFYKTAVLRYGKKFIEILRTTVKNSEILYRDAYKVLSLTPDTTQKLLEL